MAPVEPFGRTGFGTVLSDCRSAGAGTGATATGPNPVGQMYCCVCAYAPCAISPPPGNREALKAIAAAGLAGFRFVSIVNIVLTLPRKICRVHYGPLAVPAAI